MNSVSCSTIARSCQLKLELPIAIMAPPDKPPVFLSLPCFRLPLKRCHNSRSGNFASRRIELLWRRFQNVVIKPSSLVDTAQCVRCDSKTNQLLQSLRPESLCLYVRFPHASCLAFRMTHFISKAHIPPPVQPLCCAVRYRSVPFPRSRCKPPHSNAMNDVSSACAAGEPRQIYSVTTTHNIFVGTNGRHVI